MCGAVGIVVGVLSAGLGFMQHQQNIAAQNDAIAVSNANAIAQHEVSLLRTKTRQTEERQKKAMSDIREDQTIYLSNRAYEADTAQINLKLMEEEEAMAARKGEGAIEALETKGQLLAANIGGGNNIVNLINDVKRKWSRFDFLEDKGFAFVGRESAQDAKRARISWASRDAESLGRRYQKQTWIADARPILQKKIRSNTGLALLSAGLQGAQAGIGAEGSWARYKHYKGTKTSSILLKENVVKLGRAASGLGVYLYNYIGDSKKYIGAIAEEVLHVKPEAVGFMDGYLAVDYSQIDVDFKEVLPLST